MNASVIVRWCVVALLISASAALSAQEGSERTLINGESAPLIYALVERAADAGETPDRQSLVAEIRSRRNRLQALPPDGAWLVSQAPTAIVGYFAGGPSAVAYRLVYRELEAGETPVLIDRRDMVRDGSANARIEPWEVPQRPGAVTVDALGIDWVDTVPLIEFAPSFSPARIEDAATGIGFALSQSRFWPDNGLALERVSAVRGGESLALFLESRDPIPRSSSYHLAVFDSARRAPSLGEIIVPVAAVSGPVVFRDSLETLILVGFYAHRGDTVEAWIDTPRLPVAVRAALETGSWDLAAVAGDANNAERVTLATVYAIEVPVRE